MKDYSKSEFNIHQSPSKELNALMSKEELAYIPLLKKLKEDNFILYGSLASVLHLKHRHAKDFDFFTDEKISTADLESKLKNTFDFFKNAETISKDETRLVLKTEDNILFSFFTHISSGRVGKPIEIDGLKVASLQDLFAYKVNKLAKRLRTSDYQDLASFLGVKLSIAQACFDAKALFGDAFSYKDTIEAISAFIISQNFMELNAIMKENLIACLIELDKLSDENAKGTLLSTSIN